MFGLITVREHRQRLQGVIAAYREAGMGTISNLRKEVDHWKDEAGIWKNLYDKELRCGQDINKKQPEPL